MPITRPPSPQHPRLRHLTVYRWSERQFIAPGPFTSSSLRQQRLRPEYSDTQFLAELNQRLSRLAVEQDARDIDETLAGINLADLETENEPTTPEAATPIPPTHTDASTQTEPPSWFIYATSDRATYAIDTTNNRIVSWAPRA